MEPRPCDALREILLGKLEIAEFAPPRVFTSGLYVDYGVTLADLRWHMDGCPSCFKSSSELRVIFAAFDDEQFQTLMSVLGFFEDEIKDRLRQEEETAEWLASDMADQYLSNGESQAISSREGFIEANKDGLLQESRPRTYLWAVKVHAALGLRVGRWLETFLPPAFPRTFVDQDEGIVDVRVNWTEGRAGARFPSELHALLGSRNPAVGRFLFRTLFLNEAFSGLLQDDSLKDLLTEGLAVHDGLRGTEGIDWEMVWNHYSALGELESVHLSSAPTISSSGETQLSPTVIKSVTEKLERIEEQNESLMHGQTAMMGALEEIGKAERLILERYEKAPVEIQTSCLATLKDALGGLWDQLAEPSRKFLLAAEYIYSQSPADSEFSGVIVGFMKAFETELKRMVEPIQDEIRKAIAGDAQWASKNIRRFTLGDFAAVFKAKRSSIEPMLQERHLDYKRVLKAIEDVNAESNAKHQAMKGKTDATSFRTLFVGKESALRALFPQESSPLNP
jgi:hypothetical protein